MESTEFCSGYRQALDDLEARLDAFRATGTSMFNYDVSYWIETRREHLDKSTFGGDFCKTITGASTGPQDGLRSGADTP